MYFQEPETVLFSISFHPHWFRDFCYEEDRYQNRHIFIISIPEVRKPKQVLIDNLLTDF